MQLILLLAIDEEEGLVFPDRAAEGPTKLIQVELFGRTRKEAFRV